MITLRHRLILIGSLFFVSLTPGNAMSLIPPLPPGSELKALLQDVERLNTALEQNPDLLSDTRLKDLELTGLVLKNVTLSNLKLTRADWSNVTIEGATWIGVKMKESELDNVTFNRVYFNLDEAVYWGSTDFVKSRLHNVHFVESELIEVRIKKLKPSRLFFEHSKLRTRVNESHQQRSGGLGHSQLDLFIRDSDIASSIIGPLKYPSNVLIENSRVIGGVGGELKSLIIRNSHFDGNGPQRADYVLVEDSKISTGFPRARFIHLKNNEYLHDGLLGSGIGLGKVETVIIDGCKASSSLTIGKKTRIQNFHIRNCVLSEPYLKRAQVELFQLCDVKVELESEKSAISYPRAWNNASIRHLQLHNVRFQGAFPPATGLKIGHLQSGQSTLPEKLRDAARQQSPLAACPPLPDTERLKREALSDDPPLSLAVELQDRLIADYKASVPRANPPFHEALFDHLQCQLPFRHEWIEHYHNHYGLGADLLPPLYAVSAYCSSTGDWRRSSARAVRVEYTTATPSGTPSPDPTGNPASCSS
ncbi:pentapeptide repeat-containing protein [Candidatus Vondammii sp. HM_W22]|uniref:pentapeptide repeat-containing protein n=1 Tax=Candidatus Vondammii sp. HM_W22 TaxID=2687299 RepID=UPI002E7C533D|nr:hypothetical protein [Candidatus Vondammii sp. HM_W22]